MKKTLKVGLICFGIGLVGVSVIHQLTTSGYLEIAPAIAKYSLPYLIGGGLAIAGAWI